MKAGMERERLTLHRMLQVKKTLEVRTFAHVCPRVPCLSVVRASSMLFVCPRRCMCALGARQPGRADAPPVAAALLSCRTAPRLL